MYALKHDTTTPPAAKTGTMFAFVGVYSETDDTKHLDNLEHYITAPCWYGTAGTGTARVATYGEIVSHCINQIDADFRNGEITQPPEGKSPQFVKELDIEIYKASRWSPQSAPGSYMVFQLLGLSTQEPYSQSTRLMASDNVAAEEF